MSAAAAVTGRRGLSRRRRRAAAAAAVLAVLGTRVGSSSSSTTNLVVDAFAPASFSSSPAGSSVDCASVSSSLDSTAFVSRSRSFSSSSSRSRQRPCRSPSWSSSITRRFMSDVGDRGDEGGGGSGSNGGKGKGNLDDFLDDSKSESENLIRARERMAEDSLPISFGYEPAPDEEKKEEGTEATEGDDDDALDELASRRDRGEIIPMPGAARDSAATASASVGFNKPGAEDVLALAENPYLDVVSRLSPSDVISKFTTTAHPRVQDAVRTTILGLVGNLPKLGFDAATVTTGERLASLMFQLQMTGYMFKNAEYRLSLTQSLGMTKPPSTYRQMAKDGFLLEGGRANDNGAVMGEELAVDKDELEDEEALSRGKVKGKIRVKYGKNKNASAEGSQSDEEDTEDDDSSVPSAGSGGTEMEVEVDAEAYLTELRSEVTRLRDELTVARKTKEDALRKDLLLYIRTMSQDELRGLTGTMSQDVLGAMKGLVNVVMAGIGEGRIGPDTVTEQSGEAMAQLCMWQLVVGYNLRELEVREEMRAALKGSAGGASDDNKGGDDDEEDEGWR